MIMKYFIKKKLDFNVKLFHFPLLHVYKDVMHSLQVLQFEKHSQIHRNMYLNTETEIR